tara:strand:+ start:570 stop:827 length:258 start_codon:yes stop_codon:yes gene_type:complete
MVFHADYEPVFQKGTPCISVGDLVRVRGDDWIGGKLGVVTEVRELVFEQTNQIYYTITAQVDNEQFTFGPKSFELVKRAERRTKN